MLKRRNFLGLFLTGALSAARAEDGLLIDSPVAGSGLLIDPAPVANMTTVHLYTPATWHCPHCEAAMGYLSEIPEIRLILHKDDQLPKHFANYDFPVLHWAAGNGYQVGWDHANRDAFLVKIATTTKKTGHPVAIQDSGRQHWSIAGDFSPSKNSAHQHLLTDHGYVASQLVGLSREQLLTLHDSLHTATSTKQGQSCPTGTCPPRTRNQFLWFRW